MIRTPRLQSAHLKLRTNPLIPVGTRFGRWVVLESHHYKSFRTQTHRACLVRCECGTEAVRTYGELRCGHSPSCGCKSRQRSMDSVWYDLQQKWGRRGWDFDLSIPQMQCIAQMPCAYCGQEPSNVHRLKYKVGGKYQR